MEGRTGSDVFGDEVGVLPHAIAGALDLNDHGVPEQGVAGSCTSRPGSLLPLLVTCGAITALIQLGRLTSAHRADREAVVVRDDCVRRSQGPTKRFRRAAIDKGVRRSIA